MPAYCGRFAPSPTGPLHFGSLITAVVSYLHARRHGGKWFVRIEDLDPPREMPGASTLILKQLERHGFEWDGEIVYQSSRLHRYGEVMNRLLGEGAAYFCGCSRKDIQQMGGRYDGRCRHLRIADPHQKAVRIHVPEPEMVVYDDIFQGRKRCAPGRDGGDFVIRRRDHLYAYQLAVVVDDIDLGVTHIVRGIDLQDSTPRQIWLSRHLGADAPVFGHIPVAVNKFGQKLSKQNHAPSLDRLSPIENMRAALDWLGITPPMDVVYVQELLQYALEHWQAENLNSLLDLPAPIDYQ